MKANWKHVLILATTIIALTLLIVGYQQVPTQTTMPTPDQPDQTSEVQEEGPTVHNIELRVHRMGFSPDTITVQEGDIINFNILSTDGLTHGFSIDSFQIQEELPPATPVQVTLEADSKGTFTYYTHVDSHTGYSNVRGTLTIQ